MNEIFEKVLIKVKKTIKTSTLKTNYKDRAKILRSKIKRLATITKINIVDTRDKKSNS